MVPFVIYVSLGMGVSDGLGVGVSDATGVGVGVGSTVGLGVGDSETIGVGVGDSLGVGAGVGVSDGFGVSDGLGVGVGVGVSDTTGVGVGVSLGVGVGVGLCNGSLCKSLPSKPLRRAIASQSKSASPEPLSDFTTNPYIVLLATYSCPCTVVVGVIKTFNGIWSEITELKE